MVKLGGRKIMQFVSENVAVVDLA